MNELDFPIRILERSEDDICILIPHNPPSWSNRAEQKSKTDKTRVFCNWVRKQFKTKDSEYRFVNTKRARDHRYRTWSHYAYRTVNCDKHFVVYGLTRSELMMIKLAWSFKQERAGYQAGDDVDYVINVTMEPSSSYRRRVRLKEWRTEQKKAKALAEKNAEKSDE